MTNMESSTSYGPVKVSEEIDQVRKPIFEKTL
jgi:hypothetical protein